MENSHQDILKEMSTLITSVLPEWEGVKHEDLEFVHLPGLTNIVYKVSNQNPNSSLDPIICRKFNLEHKFINRENEKKLFKEIAHQKCGPKWIYDNEQYRIEEYIDSRAIKGFEYNKTPKYFRMLAREIARFHKIKLDWMPKARFLPDDLKNAGFVKRFFEKCDKKELYSEDEFKIFQEFKSVGSVKEKDFLTKLIPDDDFVLSHNDLSNGNILVTPDEKNVVLVDYEYAGINFRGFDLGYIFHQARVERIGEHPYFKLVDGNFLTEENLKLFLKYYILFSDLSNDKHYSEGQELIENNEKFDSFMAEHYKESELEERLLNLKKQTILGVLACNHYIITWATGMAKTGNFKFGHFEFAKGGYDYYQTYKKALEKLL